MSSIDEVDVDSFFAEFLQPLRRFNARQGVNYLAGQSAAPTYWNPVASRIGGIQRVPKGELDGEALIRALGAYWSAQGDAALPQLAPFLALLRRHVLDSRTQQNEGHDLPEFVYPLF